MTNFPRGKLLRRRDLASYLAERWGLRCAAQTLAKYAVEGKGPPFRRYGRDVVYDTADADEWAQGRLSGPVRSTSDRDPVPAAA